MTRNAHAASQVRRTVGLLVLTLLPLATIATLACSTKADLVGAGGDCELASDCEANLICIAQKDGKRTCDSDLSKVQPEPPSKTDAAATPDASGDANGADAPASETTPDPDTSVPADTSPGTDTSPPPPDTSPPPPDTSPPPPDTSTVPDTSQPDVASPG